MRLTRQILAIVPLTCLVAAGCESDTNSSNRPAASVVSPDSNAGFGGSGGVNGMYDQPAPSKPDGTSGRYGGSGIISGGNSGRTEETLRPGSP